MHTDPVTFFGSGRAARPAIPWQDWGEAAFARARTEGRPILLTITAFWSAGCASMDREAFADPAIVSLVDRAFVPVRVDSDRRPDLNERYNLGGWPTTAFLTPAGDLLWGGTYFEVDELAAALRRVLAAFGGHRAGAANRAPRAGPASVDERAGSRAVDTAAPEWVCEWLLSVADRQFGGFGTGVKHHASPALALLLQTYRDRPDGGVADVLVLTLDAICRALYDPVDGGFFRYSARRDWGEPRSEKLLEDNAALTAVLLEAADVLERPHYRECALGALQYVRETLADGDLGGFFSSQRGDDGYFSGRTRAARHLTPAPPVDRTCYVDSNAAMASVWLQAAARLDDRDLRDFALLSLERVALAAYRPGAGVAHVAPPDHASVRGLLQDQVRLAGALVTSAALTGQVPHMMMAEELLQYAIRTMWDDRHGGFVDRAASGSDAEGLGLLADPLKPFEGNCEAARTLVRLAGLSGTASYRDLGVQALASQTSSYRQRGLEAAHYALAVREIDRAAQNSA